MSSMSEMLQYAQAIDKKKQGLTDAIGNFGEAVGTGILAGQELKHKRILEQANLETARMERAYKMIQIQDKMQEIEKNRQTEELQTNLGKAIGTIPMTDQEMAHARQASFAGIGDTTTQSQMGSGNTKVDKLKALFKSPDTETTFGKDGITFKIKNGDGKDSKRTAGQEDELRFKIRKGATDAAHAAKLEKAVAMNPNFMLTNKPNDIVPTEDEIQAFVPAITASLGGDVEGTRKKISQAMETYRKPVADLKEAESKVATLTESRGFLGRFNSKKNKEISNWKKKADDIRAGVKIEDPFGLIGGGK